MRSGEGTCRGVPRIIKEGVIAHLDVRELFLLVYALYFEVDKEDFGSSVSD